MHGHSYTNSFHSLYRESPKNNEFIFDEIYRNASNKHKYSSNPKYTYFNALMQLKGKLSDNDGVYRKVFEAPRNKVHSSEVTAWPHTSVAPAPIYYVQKINKMKFKIYKDKDGLSQTRHTTKLPVTNINFQLHSRNLRGKSIKQQRPRLENILAEYQRMNITARDKGRQPREHGQRTTQRFIKSISFGR